MQYVISCLTTRYKRGLLPLLSQIGLPVVSQHTEGGFTTAFVECDRATAERIWNAGYHVSEV
jgi:hypothetical protein